MAYIGNSPFPKGNFSATTHNGGTAVFTMGQSPGTKNAVLVFIDGVRQDPLNYSIAGATLTLGTAAPAGTNNVQILVSGEELSVNVPADDSIAVAALDTTSAGTTGQYLQKSGASTIDWATVPDEVATQTGQAGKYLTTDGATTSWGTVATTDTTNIEGDIALLGFRVAMAGSLSKYNLVDQTEDAFYDDVGIDPTLSTGEQWNAAYYYSGAPSVVQTYTELVATAVITAGMLSQSGLISFTAANLIDGGIVAPNYGFHTDSSGVGSWCQLDFGAGNQYSIRRWGWYMGAGGNVYAEWKVQHSDDTVTWTDWNSGATFGGHPATPAWYYSGTPANVAGMRHRYWRTYKTDAAAVGNFHMELLFDAYDEGPFSDMVLVSNATTAETQPTKADLVMTYTNGLGTALVGTDLKAYASRDDGTNWTELTLGAKGTTGTSSPHFILTAHDVDISSQNPGTSMRYKIETFNQGVAKETRIQAVSLGWS